MFVQVRTEKLHGFQPATAVCCFSQLICVHWHAGQVFKDYACEVPKVWGFLALGSYKEFAHEGEYLVCAVGEFGNDGGCAVND